MSDTDKILGRYLSLSQVLKDSRLTLVVLGNSGGGAGYVEATINNPAATYSYSVGAGGAGGNAGTNGGAGEQGGSGVIIVEEFYQ